MTDKELLEQEKETAAMTRRIKKQAEKGDKVCAAMLTEIALQTKIGGGCLWIETQLDMEDFDDDFRPY